METWLQIILAVLGSSGLWAGVWALIMSKREQKIRAKEKEEDKKSASNRMLLGIGHDRIIWLCLKYIERGWITKDEYEDLRDYLYAPYKDMGGNGTVEKLMAEVEKLPVRNVSYLQKLREDSGAFGWFGRRRKELF